MRKVDDTNLNSLKNECLYQIERLTVRIEYAKNQRSVGQLERRLKIYRKSLEQIEAALNFKPEA